MRSAAPHADVLVRAPGPHLGDVGLVDAPDADMRDLPHVRRIRVADHLILTGLIGETVADLKLHREDLGIGRCLRCALLLRTWLSHPRLPSHPYFCLSRCTSPRALRPD